MPRIIGMRNEARCRIRLGVHDIEVLVSVFHEFIPVTQVEFRVLDGPCVGGDVHLENRDQAVLYTIHRGRGNATDMVVCPEIVVVESEMTVLELIGKQEIRMTVKQTTLDVQTPRPIAKPKAESVRIDGAFLKIVQPLV